MPARSRCQRIAGARDQVGRDQGARSGSQGSERGRDQRRGRLSRVRGRGGGGRVLKFMGSRSRSRVRVRHAGSARPRLSAWISKARFKCSILAQSGRASARHAHRAANLPQHSLDTRAATALSAHGDATIDADDLTRDVGALIGHEKCAHGGNVERTSQALLERT